MVGHEYLTPHEPDILPSGLLDVGRCQPLAGSWSPPRVHVIKHSRTRDGCRHRLRRGDFLSLAGALVVSPDLLPRVLPFFGAGLEVLPLPFEGRIYSLLHVMTCLDCLDPERSDWLLTETGRRALLRGYVFRPACLGEHSVFNIPEAVATIIALERSGDPGEEFKAFVEIENLTGLTFMELWRSGTD